MIYLILLDNIGVQLTILLDESGWIQIENRDPRKLGCRRCPVLGEWSPDLALPKRGYGFFQSKRVHVEVFFRFFLVIGVIAKDKNIYVSYLAVFAFEFLLFFNYFFFFAFVDSFLFCWFLI